MKESELIIMKRKIEQLGALMQGVLQELTNLRDLSVGTLQTIKNMPDYEEAIKKLEEQMKENETKKEGIPFVEKDVE
jgi:predicted ATP-grasp superfamily ATP-dependent carboligase